MRDPQSREDIETFSDAYRTPSLKVFLLKKIDMTNFRNIYSSKIGYSTSFTFDYSNVNALRPKKVKVRTIGAPAEFFLDEDQTPRHTYRRDGAYGASRPFDWRPNFFWLFISLTGDWVAVEDQCSIEGDVLNVTFERR